MKHQKKRKTALILTPTILLLLLVSKIKADPTYTMISELSKTLSREKDQLKREMTSYYISKLMASSKTKYHQLQDYHLKKLLQSKENYCLNGRTRSSMSDTEYIRKFSEGPCNPIVILPGIAASKLRISIDCEKLKASEPKTFEDCGWNTCQKTGASGEYIPEKEYNIWAPDIFSPMSIFKATEKTRSCFGGLMEFIVRKYPESGEIELKEKDGVKVTALGDSEMTKEYHQSECGFKAIEDMIPFVYVPHGYKYYKNMKETFIKAGYQVGVNLQALPYDFRKHFGENKLNFKFKDVIEKMNKISGKKVTIIAHSFGNYQVLNNLWKLDQEFKDKTISKYIAIAPPYLGAPKVALSGLGMDSSYRRDWKILDVGITAKTFKQTVGTYEGTFDLLPKDFYNRWKDTEWMKSLLNRINKEENNIEKREKKKHWFWRKLESDGDDIMNIFPNISDKCMPGFEKRGEKCITNLFHFEEFGEIEGKSIKPSTVKDIFKDYSYNPFHPEMLEQTIDKRFVEFENPGVQVNIIFSSVLPTISKFKYKGNPKTKTLNDEFYEPEEIEYKMGDGSVLVTSAISPGIKWAYEFNNDSTGKLKPVNFIEICSEVNKNTSIYDGEGKVTENRYIGTDCNCRDAWIGKSTGDACDHKKIVEDSKVIDFIFNSASDGEKGEPDSEFLELGNKAIAEYYGKCKMFTGED